LAKHLKPPGTGHTDAGQELVWNRTGGERQSDFDQLGQLNLNGGGGGAGFLKVALVENGFLLSQNPAKGESPSESWSKRGTMSA
ncbi:uncharacterized protein METZ01_LOCUS173368, partial [marine metagenome]